MQNGDPLALRHTGPTGLDELQQQILRVYSASHADQMHNPWFHPDQFWDRLINLYAPTRAFDLVSGWRDEEMVGYAFGSARDTDNPWPEIRRVLPHLQPDQPVYIFREFAVHPDWQRRSYGHEIHDELLRNREEQVAQLLVRPDNGPALAAYHSWGWVKATTKQPFPDSPVFDLLILDLTVRRSVKDD
ncbi:GNAT family N-acetyltransferase [Dactylosporangium sp. NPDC051485]|uniref:GNAT family N-acetyltransferase n=1 Tax=Dactylosporangium sp. NPDC051485 TaxID=3154846 RepID=UPI00341CD213